MRKMTLYTLYNKIEQLEKVIDNIGRKFEQEFRPIDYREYIKQPISNFHKIWKYNGLYYRNASKLHEIIARKEGYTKTKRTFVNLLEDDDRQPEMWEYNIQLVYAWKGKRYLTCEGKFLTADQLVWIRGNPNNNKMMLYNEDESFVVSRSHAVWDTFVDLDFKPTQKLLYFDGFYGNCAIDNLTVAIAGATTKGAW